MAEPVVIATWPFGKTAATVALAFSATVKVAPEPPAKVPIVVPP